MTLLYLEAYMNFKVRVKMITPLKQPSTTKPVEQPLDYFFFLRGEGDHFNPHPPTPSYKHFSKPSRFNNSSRSTVIPIVDDASRVKKKLPSSPV